MNDGVIGKRIKLISTDDPHTKLKPGTQGVVVMRDSLGTLHVDWDDGSKLGLIPGVDRFEIIPDGCRQ